MMKRRKNYSICKATFIKARAPVTRGFCFSLMQLHFSDNYGNFSQYNWYIS